MAVMQCDICGNTLTMDVSGEFAICEFCGIKHPKQRLINKISGAPVEDDSDDKISYTGEPVAAVDVSGFADVEESHIEEEKVDEVVEETVDSVKDNTQTDIFADSTDTYESDIMTDTDEVEKVEDTVGEDTYKELEEQISSIDEEKAVEDDIDFLDDEPVMPPPIVGSMDIGIDADDDFLSDDNSGQVIVSTASENIEEIENEKKQERIEELKNELAEFEEIFEANKNKFLGEGLRKKNYSEAKIKEIKEKLVELGVEVSLDTQGTPEAVISEESEPEYELEELNVDEMTPGEREEYEKKVKRVQELKDELQEFKDIYEANKSQFFGEGLKRKNYSEIKIKEIREKLTELTS